MFSHTNTNTLTYTDTHTHTNMLVNVYGTVKPAVLVSEKQTGDMFCLHKTFKKQTIKNNWGVEELIAEPSSSCGKMFLPVKMCVFPGGKERMWKRLAVAWRQERYT